METILSILFFSLGGFISYIFLSWIDTSIHEHCHWLAMLLVKKSTPEFTEEIRTTIYYKNWVFSKSGFTMSNYLRFLSDDPVRYGRQIKKIARAGILYSSILYLIVGLITFLLGPIWMSSIIGTCFIFALREIFMYATSKKEMCDRKVVKHPELYKLDPNEFMSEGKWHKSLFCRNQKK